MPQFETYERQVRPTSEGVGNLMGYREVAQANQTTQEAIQTVDYIAKAWDEADYIAQKTTAMNNLQAQMLAFEEDLKTTKIQAGEDGDYYKVFDEKKKSYEERLNAIKSNASTITNPRAKAEYEQTTGILFQKAKIGLDSAFRDKQIEHQKVELVRNGDMMKRLYVASGNEQAKTEYINQLNNNFRAGFIDEAEKTKFIEEVKKWDSSHILNIAETDPNLAFEMLEQKDLMAEEKAEILKDIKAIQASKEIEADVKMLERYSANRVQLTQTILDDNMKYTDKKDALDNALNYGDIDEDSYKRLTNALMSRNAVDAKTNMITKTNLLKEIQTFASEFPAEYIRSDYNNAREYYRRKAKMTDMIDKALSKGELSKNDYLTLQKEISEENSMPAKEGAFLSTVKTEAKYNETYMAIEKAIGGSETRANAINEYFETVKRGLGKTEQPDYAKLKKEIIKKYKLIERQQALLETDPNRLKARQDLIDKGIEPTEQHIAYVLAKRAKNEVR